MTPVRSSCCRILFAYGRLTPNPLGQLPQTLLTTMIGNKKLHEDHRNMLTPWLSCRGEFADPNLLDPSSENCQDHRSLTFSAVVVRAFRTLSAGGAIRLWCLKSVYSVDDPRAGLLAQTERYLTGQFLFHTSFECVGYSPITDDCSTVT